MRFIALIGAVEACAYLTMMTIEDNGLLVGLVGAAVFALGTLVTRSQWKIAPIPVLIYGAVFLPPLWFMIDWLDERYLGNHYGAFASGVSGALSAAVLGGLFWFVYREISGRLKHKGLRRLLTFSDDRGFHPALIAGFAVYEGVFVFLEVLLGQYHIDDRLLPGAVAWFFCGAFSAWLGLLAVRGFRLGR